MAEQKVAVKGDFRAGLALLISIVAIILALIALYRSSGRATLENRIKTLNAKIKTMADESSAQMSKILKETKENLQKLTIEVERKGQKPQASPTAAAPQTPASPPSEPAAGSTSEQN